MSESYNWFSWPHPSTEGGAELKGDLSSPTMATVPVEHYQTLLKRNALLVSLEFEGVEHWEGYARAKKRAEDNS
ncbi:host recBCD nuclease inhibitor protein [Rhizobium phage RHph_N34]|uniref:Host recBCD nuclease inhibitor protein n=1 Tax=Rhizobium phage RHph_N34 TaxID=2509586 RepID=A0A7S5RA86_9CAUD|nr:host recBCD nuclease inhibitor protein [Rhizobium phage RHph_N34]QIG73970.1 host recBCD nuclease inhibitor protein [Rhizobium phage RHph_N34]